MLKSFSIIPDLYSSYSLLVSPTVAAVAALVLSKFSLHELKAGRACLINVNPIRDRIPTKAPGLCDSKDTTGPSTLLANSNPAVATFFKLANSWLYGLASISNAPNFSLS